MIGEKNDRKINFKVTLKIRKKKKKEI